MSADIVFLLGLPRSGTKLLRDLLNRHPDVAIFPHESHFFPVLRDRLPRYGPISDWKNFEKMYGDISGNAFFRRMSARGTTIDARAWFDSVHGEDFPALISGLFDLYRRISGARIVGDKSPSYVGHVAVLADALPAAKFLHILRDPRDQALSMRAAWGKQLVRSAARWKAGVRKCRSAARSRAIAYHEVRYEDLLRDARGTMGEVCAFLGIGFVEELLSLEEASENLGDARGERSILASNVGKWQHRLDRDELLSIESVAGQCMKEFGYVPALQAGDRNPGMAESALSRAADAYNLLTFTVRQEGGLGPALRHLWQVWRFRPDDSG